MKTTLPGLWIAAVALLGCEALTPVAPGSFADEERAARVSAGRELFASYCTSCHGAAADGTGPAATALVTQPADLRRIAQRHGAFIPSEVAARIDGRNEVAAHGTREMPAWGRLYDDRNESLWIDETLLSPAAIFAIVEYLETLQLREGER